MFNRPHWSYSAINQYLACPLRYYFQRILCLPQPTIGSSLVLGSTVHAVLAEYHRSIQDDEPTNIDHLHQVFTESWSSRENQTRLVFRNGETAQASIDLGIALVELYLKEPPPQEIIGIEREIISPIHNSQGAYLETPLVAIADLITKSEAKITVREFKTSGRAYSEIEAETSLQPTCYVNAAQEAYGQPASVEYTVLIKTKTPKIQRLAAERTESDLGRLGDIIENIEKAVQLNIFYPVENPINCSTCPFRQPCREWGRSEPTKIQEPSQEPVEAGVC
jgi:CRISPR/Cas system-associated exonuclease Cas4 (RecB family)